MIDIEKEFEACARMTDDRLLGELKESGADERQSLVRQLIRLAEFEKRELGLERGYSSAFDFCVRVLRYSRSDAYKRIAVAKKSKQFPSMLAMIERGELHLYGASLLAGLLTAENHRTLLAQARNKSEDDIARLVASLDPRRAPKDTIRILSAPPDSAPAPQSPPPSLPSVAVTSDFFDAAAEPAPAPTPAELYQIAFTATRETRDLLLRAKELLRHRFPKAETGAIVKLALQNLLAELDRDLRAPSKKPAKIGAGPRTRRVPESVKQEAWDRDAGQCAFVAPDGTRCTSRAWLEFDHARPFALGGSSRDADNIRAYCRPHNQWAARRMFGRPDA